ncbi:MAG: hypothetical protein Q4B13_00250 [Lautropia sp.]|nr:hypothetical protein [Lautropia sp.]
MKPKIVFVVMSAIHSADSVAQLARSLAPHTVLVHHDFSQTPDFSVNEPNVRFVPQPKRTGWAIWGFSEGIFHAMRYAYENLEFDYLQILSPTCLPIKPIKAIEEHVASNKTDVDFAWIDMLTDEDALMTAAYRGFAGEESFRHRLLRRMMVLYFNNTAERRDVAGVQLRTGGNLDSQGKLRPVARLARFVTRLFVNPTIGGHVFTKSFSPYYGSTWFGARRPVIGWMLERFTQPDIQRHFPKLRIADEYLIPSMLMQAVKQQGLKHGPMNHCIVTFIEANPAWLTDADFDFLKRSHAFFGRKFPDDIRTPIRRRVLTELVGMTSAQVIPPEDGEEMVAVTPSVSPPIHTT